MIEFIIMTISILSLILAIIFYCVYYKTINYYPNLSIQVDITKKNKMDNNDVLDYFIINYGIEILLNR